MKLAKAMQTIKADKNPEENCGLGFRVAYGKDYCCFPELGEPPLPTKALAQEMAQEFEAATGYKDVRVLEAGFYAQSLAEKKRQAIENWNSLYSRYGTYAHVISSPPEEIAEAVARKEQKLVSRALDMLNGCDG